MSGDHLSQPGLSPSRNGEQVAKWVFDVASKRTDAEFELVDLLDYPLPHLDEPLPPSLGQVVAWSTALAPLRQPAASEA